MRGVCHALDSPRVKFMTRGRGVRSNVVTALVGIVSRRARAVPWKRTSEGISLADSRIGHGRKRQVNGGEQVGKE